MRWSISSRAKDFSPMAAARPPQREHSSFRAGLICQKIIRAFGNADAVWGSHGRPWVRTKAGAYDGILAKVERLVVANGPLVTTCE